MSVPVKKVRPEVPEISKEEKKKVEAFDEMMELLARKVNSVTSSKAKLQILTLAPSNWRHKQVSEHFGVSMFLARSARKLRSDK